MNLTILIPALNEEQAIEMVVKKAKNFIEKNSIDGEILVVNNNSIDKTEKIARINGARVVKEENKGYGNALRKGIEKAQGKYIIMGDADDSYNFLEIKEMYDTLINGCDLVIGNRFYHIQKGAMKFSHRYIGTPLLNHLVNHKYKVKIKDVNCGLRGFKKEKIKGLNLKSEGMEFASEMIIKAIKNNLKICQVNINFYKDARKGKGHLHAFKDGIRHIKVILSE